MLRRPIACDPKQFMWRGMAILASLLDVLPCAAGDAAEVVRDGRPAAARPYLVRGSERRLLDRAELFLADEQWDDAIAVLQRVLGSGNPNVVASHDRVFVGLPEYCHKLLAQLPAEPLKRYRQLVHGVAENWYREGIANRDATRLQRIVDEHFCSDWGDEALDALGELALQRGEYQAARNAWSRIACMEGGACDGLVFPDTQFSLARVQARLALTSIREGNFARAESELRHLRENYPDARGRLAGREVMLADQLARLLEHGRVEAVQRGRNSTSVLTSTSEAELVWSRPLANSQLGVFPVVSGNLVMYQDATSVGALHLRNGDPLFQTQEVMFRSGEPSTEWFGLPSSLLSVAERRVFGVTTAPVRLSSSELAGQRSSFWGLDLQREGALAVHQFSDEPGVAFAGAPIVEENLLFVPIYSAGQALRAGVACYDATTGDRHWQRWLCKSNTHPAGAAGAFAVSRLSEDSGIIYTCTNLGVVAAIRAVDGRPLWLRTYECEAAELSGGDDSAQDRAPSRCIYHHGVVFALPTDGNTLLALDATTGTMLWDYLLTDPNPVLVGVTQASVVLQDGGLRVLGRRTGELMMSVPDAKPVGHPAILGEWVAWSDGTQVQFTTIVDGGMELPQIPLPETGGANLSMASGGLLVAGASRLSLFRFPAQADSSSSSEK